MVIKNDTKKDVFSDFHLDDKVGSNERSLEDAEHDENYKVSDLVDNNIFADFKLDEIVKENEERERRKQQQELAAANADESSPSKGGRGGGAGKLVRRLSMSNLRKSLSGNDLSKLADDDEGENSDQKSGGTGTTANADDTGGKKKTKMKKRKSKNNLLDNLVDANEDEPEEVLGGGSTANNGKKHPSQQRRNTAMTVPDEYYTDEPTNHDFHDGDHDHLKKVQMAHNASNATAVSKFAMSNGGVDDSFQWKSTQQSDNIFSDFDLDSIVKDYEKVQRKINFQPGVVTALKGGGLSGQNPEDEEDEDGYDANTGTTAMGIHVRYRGIKRFWVDNFPRTHGILFRVIAPLMFLVGISILLGIGLADIEMVGEVADNDAAMRSIYELDRYPYDETLEFLFNLPTVCFDHYVSKKDGTHNGDANVTTVTYDMIKDSETMMYGYTADYLDVDPSTLTQDYLDAATSNISLWSSDNETEISAGNSDESVAEEIRSYLKVCEDAGSALIRDFIEVTTAKMQSGSDLTFNWMRCWNTTQWGTVNPFRATPDLLVQAGNQSDFYHEMWNADQQRLYALYLEEGSEEDPDCSSLQCRKDAHERSVQEATGSEMCNINKGATAWFWMVFMTTVGYGNQSPTTTMGRLYCGLLGWMLIICWAIVLFVSGKVLGIIMDDFFRRCNCRKATGDVQSVFIWGLIALTWMAFVGTFAFRWFNRADDPLGFEWGHYGGNQEDLSIQLGDSYWFAYISLLTVGLGDYYLIPEYMFYFDLFLWSYFFLVGFTFLSTWLGQVADLVNTFFPDSGDALKERLMNTDLVGHREVEYKKQNEIGIQKLERLVELMDDDDLDVVTQRVTRIRVKNYVLSHLLYQTKIELDYYKKRGERYENLSFTKVCEEENMLNECLAAIVKEREKLEAYRDGRTEEVTITSQATRKVSHSMLDENGKKVCVSHSILEQSADDIDYNLSLKAGKKKWKKKSVTKPSLHL